MAYNRRKRKTEHGRIVVLAVVSLLAIAGYMQVEWMQGQRTTKIKRHPTQKIPCRACEGQGQIPNPEDVPNFADCPYCFGVGFRYIRRLGTEFSVCPTCIGMGRELYEIGGQVRECDSCAGFGVVKKSYDGVKTVDEIKEYPVEQTPPPPPPTATNQTTNPAEEPFDATDLLKPF